MIIGKAISPFAIKRRNGGGGGTDADAQAFITASGISGTEATAINTLVVTLKSANIWTKMKAVYPMVGGTATSCKWNLKNPVDSNAAYRLVFSGGGTFSANGYLPNGTNAYADTFLVPSSALTNNSTHVSFYSRTNSSGLYFDIGSGQPTGQYFDLALNITGNIYADQYNNSTGRITTANANSQGFYISSRTTSNVFKLFKNAAQLGTTNVNASNGFASITSSFYLSALHEGGGNLYFSNRQCAFASIGDGLTDAEALSLYNAVQLFNTTLGRQV
jgi:hypothetical protein